MTIALAPQDTPSHDAPQSTAAEGAFLQDVITGLAMQPKALAPKYFYDERGSQLFDDICALEEYYPYHVELELLPSVAADLGRFFHDELKSNDTELGIVEFGAGSLRKIAPLLNNIDCVSHLTAIDISKEHLLNSCAELRRQYCNLKVTAQAQDFTQPLNLEDPGSTRLGFFPGSTIGNLHREQALDFLRNAGQTLGAGGYLLIGVDTKKTERLLHQAYNDDRGVTAQFNKNILTRINRELGGDFDLMHFAHHAFYNHDYGRIEMHLRSLRAQRVHIAEREFYFAKGESIHTENSYKYHPSEFADLARQAHWHTRRLWLAPDDLFAISLLQFNPAASAPDDH